MSRERIIYSDVVVVGSGIAGLTTAKMLSEQGYAVSVVEKNLQIASGATTRNEGWLHAGTYHAVAIEDPDEAKQVTGRSRFGYDYITSHIPECVEDPQEQTFAVVQDPNLVDFAEARWKDADINIERIPLQAFTRTAPEIAIDQVAAAFRAEDKGINTRVLCDRLLGDIRKKGGKIFTSAKFEPQSDDRAIITFADRRRHILQSNLFIITSGVAIRDLFEKMLHRPFPMRYMKSHLLIMPRLMDYSAFSIDVGEAGIINHGDNSIIGINRDGIPVDIPDYEPVREKEALIADAVERLVPHASRHRQRAMGVACIKPDIYQKIDSAMNLNVTIGEPKRNYLYAVPGKMTEAPYLAQALVNLIDQRQYARTPVQTILDMDVYGDVVMPRPCDTYDAT